MKSAFIIKNVLRRMKRYGFLVTMISFGIAAVTLVQSVTVGMSQNVTQGSARYLGGRWLVIARTGTGYAENRVDDPAALEAALRSSGFIPSITVRREVSGDNNPTLFFNGESFLVRRVSGVNFEAEATVFDRLAFDEGGYRGLKGTNAILISRQVAQRFKVRVGDEMTLRLVNQDGYLDSGIFIVRGIFRDASIFGYYNCYVDYEALRTLSGERGEACNTLGFYFADGAKPLVRAQEIRTALAAAGYDVRADVLDRSTLEEQRNLSWEGTRYAVLPVENYIDDKVMDLIQAIQLISYLFLGLTLLVILVGMRNTTQIMTRRRTREIGTIRALGMTSMDATRMVMGESLFVASIGFVLGVAAAVLSLIVISLIPFDWSDGFDIFLDRGHLGWSLSPGFLVANFLALAGMTVTGSYPAARHAASIAPAAAMSSND